MICAEWWAYEILTLISGTQSQLILDTQSALYTTLNLTFMFPLGIGVAAGTLVGNALGSGNPVQAKRSAQASIASTWPLSIVFAGSILAMKSIWGHIFSTDPAITETISDMVPYVVLAIITDGGQGVASGIIRGSGHLMTGGILNLIAYYAIAVPIGSVCTYVLKMGNQGLFIAICSGSFFQCSALLTALYLFDWNKLSEEAENNPEFMNMDKAEEGQEEREIIDIEGSSVEPVNS